MARLRAFHGLLPPPDLAARLSCPPYDVVSELEARATVRNNPYSFMRIIRAEVDLAQTISPYDDAVYAQGRANLQAFEQAGWLQRHTQSQLLIYRMRSGRHVQTGVAGCCSVEEYESGLICKHENTKPDKENDRTRHVLTLAAHAEAVLLAYRGRSEIDELVLQASAHAPLFDFTAEDGVQHTLWRTPSTEELVHAFQAVPRLYIADGHHRCASAARACAEIRRQEGVDTGREAYNFFPAVLFPAEQLRILPYNRLVVDLAEWNPEDLLTRLRHDFEFAACASASPQRKGEVSLYFDGQWHGIVLRVPTASDPVSQLDLTRLQQQLLEPYFQIIDQRTDKRIDFVGGVHGTESLRQAVDRKKAQCAISLFPPSLEELFAVSDRGELMPPKSTWFEPKLRSGLFVHAF